LYEFFAGAIFNGPVSDAGFLIFFHPSFFLHQIPAQLKILSRGLGGLMKFKVKPVDAIYKKKEQKKVFPIWKDLSSP
jgi:hypothetical protein